MTMTALCFSTALEGDVNARDLYGAIVYRSFLPFEILWIQLSCAVVQLTCAVFRVLSCLDIERLATVVITSEALQLAFKVVKNNSGTQDVSS